MHSRAIPPDYLRKALDTMEKSWQGIEGGKVYANNWINSMIGTFDIQEDSAWLLRSSRTEDDLKPLSNRRACLKFRTDYEGGSIYDYVLKTKLVDNASFRPIHDSTLHTEAARMGQALAINKNLGRLKNVSTNSKQIAYYSIQGGMRTRSSKH